MQVTPSDWRHYFMPQSEEYYEQWTSKWMLLEKGAYYPIEGIHEHTQAAGDDDDGHFTVSVEYE